MRKKPSKQPSRTRSSAIQTPPVCGHLLHTCKLPRHNRPNFIRRNSPFAAPQRVDTLAIPLGGVYGFDATTPLLGRIHPFAFDQPVGKPLVARNIGVVKQVVMTVAQDVFSTPALLRLFLPHAISFSITFEAVMNLAMAGRADRTNDRGWSRPPSETRVVWCASR